nr:MAG TPA: hypothetical protein [Bacteriophage sp.]
MQLSGIINLCNMTNSNKKNDNVAAIYSLPEINIYPQNRFGDIARKQGLETARN